MGRRGERGDEGGKEKEEMTGERMKERKDRGLIDGV